MPKVIVTAFSSLDGVIENPMWTMAYWNDEIAAFKGEETSANEALLLGRVTYEGFAEAWPQRSGADSGADYFNGTRKYVVSKTLQTLTWNNAVLLEGDPWAAIRQLKQAEGPNLVVHGSAKLVEGLLAQGLVDEVRLLVYPLVLGQGKRLFQAGMAATLTLLRNQTFTGGVVGLVYQVQPAQ
jgi:dihydrofolate reductase